MKKDIVIKKIQEAIDSKSRRVVVFDIDPTACAQIATAYVSGAKGMLPLYSKEAVAKYYETTEKVVSDCIDRAIRFRLIKFSTVLKIVRNSADNERRHAEHSSLTKSEKRYAQIIEDRFSIFKKTIDDGENKALYDSVYKLYLGHTSLKSLMDKFGLSLQEVLFLLRFKACVDMTPVEYDIFKKKFFNDFLGTPYYTSFSELTGMFRKNMSELLEKQETPEWPEARKNLVAYFNSKNY